MVRKVDRPISLIRITRRKCRAAWLDKEDNNLFKGKLLKTLCNNIVKKETKRNKKLKGVC